MTRRTALFLSPHLDDVAFSCGGLVAILSDAGWHTVLATVFTRTILPAKGFALACQLDKGLSEDVDYMALRRQEDLHAAAELGVSAVHWLDFPEAPHRGYESAPALFGTILQADTIVHDVAASLADLDRALQPTLVLAPQGLGNHVDHQLVVQAALQVFTPARIAFYRDAPYVMRNPDARAVVGIHETPDSSIAIARVLHRKIAASSAYTTQIGFQFGGAPALAEAMRAFAEQEGGGHPAERFIGLAWKDLA